MEPGSVSKERSNPLDADALWARLREVFDRGEGLDAAFAAQPMTAQAAELLQIYAPLAAPLLAFAQLGQSLDGFIATTSGDSYYVTGERDREHLHRLRALADAVIVGAGTVVADDPQLTVRHVPGRHPVRVVLDPRRRIPRERRVFQDASAPTLWLGTEPAASPAPHVECVHVDELSMTPGSILNFLSERGLNRVLVEGGGITVSRFLAAGALQRLFVTVAPLIVGEGRRGLQLPGTERLCDALRPPVRHFRLGDDLLFDFDLVKRS